MQCTIGECPICPFKCDSLLKLEEHINRQHFDLTSPSVKSQADPPNLHQDDIFNCPICVTSFLTAPDLEFHVNIEHKDILSPPNNKTKACTDATISNSVSPVCPVCMKKTFKTNEALTLQ